jgi:hypothetical protein
LDWSRPDEDYIKKCSQNAGKKIAPEVDQRDAYEKKDEEEVEEEEGVESDQGTSSKGVQPQNKSKRNNPALARNEQVPGGGQLEQGPGTDLVTVSTTLCRGQVDLQKIQLRARVPITC